METKDIVTLVGIVVGPALAFFAAFLLERRRTRLGMESTEHGIRFKVRYEKLSSVLSDVSKKLTDAKLRLQELTLLNGQTGDREELFMKCGASLKDATLFIEDHRLYIQDSIYSLIDKMLTRYADIAEGFIRDLRKRNGPYPDPDIHFWGKALEAIQEQEDESVHIRRLFRQALELQEFCH